MKNLKAFNESVYANSHSAKADKIINMGYDVEFRFAKSMERFDKVANTMQRLYDNHFKGILFPQLGNLMFKVKGGKGKNEYAWIVKGNKDVIDHDELKKYKNKTLILDPMATYGRHDVNSSMNYSMSDAEKAKAKSIYKGKGNAEYSFYLRDGMEVDIVISKSAKFFTLIIENGKTTIPSLFVKMPKWETIYLKEGWVKEERLIELIKKLDAKVAPLHKSVKLKKFRDDIGVFD